VKLESQSARRSPYHKKSVRVVDGKAVADHHSPDSPHIVAVGVVVVVPSSFPASSAGVLDFHDVIAFVLPGTFASQSMASPRPPGETTTTTTTRVVPRPLPRWYQSVIGGMSGGPDL
jgi:hypothetical protein